ncbi:Palmitoyl-acyl carrier protein thioesterase, chloroplastic-like protein [Drosera capensis]
MESVTIASPFNLSHCTRAPKMAMVMASMNMSSTQSRLYEVKEKYRCVRKSSRTGMLCVKAIDHGRSMATDNGKRVNGCTTVALPFDMLLEKKKENGKDHNDDHADRWTRGILVEEGSVFSQNFLVRSYDIGPDKNVRLERIMNFLQEASLNHMKITGVAAENEFGVTNAMNRMDLIWVINRMHIEVNHFSTWGDVVEVDTWYDTSGKNSFRRYWQMRDRKTRQILTKATSNFVLMNKETRRMSRVPLEVRDELQPFNNPKSVLEFGGEDSEKIDKLSDEMPNMNIRSNLMPRGSDMDMNQHVNSCKYIALILESVPKDVLRNYALTSVTLEYRRECSQGDALESLMVMNRSVSATSYPRQAAHYESTHLLRRQDDKAEIARALIRWQYPKRS